MTRVLRRQVCLALVVALGLSGCGTDRNANVGTKIIKQTATQLFTGRKKRQAAAAAPAPAITRAALDQFHSPMMQIDVPTIGLTTFIVPFGQNGAVETWSSVDDQTISFRQGIMIATRGFGPDMMESIAPGAAQIASGAGTYDRAYYYLDGADQTQRFDYTCTLANLGVELITVVDKQHSTRHIMETCHGKQGNFVNEYWFENGNFLRKSKQLLVQPWAPITFQRVIDNG